MAPEQFLADAPTPPLLDRHRQDAADPAANCRPAAHRILAADLAQLLGEHRAVFDPMPVGVDHRMIEPGLDLRGGQMGAHDAPPSGHADAATVVPRRPPRKPFANGVQILRGSSYSTKIMRSSTRSTSSPLLIRSRIVPRRARAARNNPTCASRSALGIRITSPGWRCCAA